MRSESSKFELSFILEGLDKIRSQIWGRKQILINMRYLDKSKKNIGTVAPPLAVVKFGSKSRCPVTLTYIRRSKSLYRWALPGSDFYFQIWPPQGVEPLFQYLFCFSLYRWVLPGSDFEIDVDRFHIIFFLLKTTLFGSKSSKFESKSRCLLMLTYRRYCLSLNSWGLLGSDFEIDVDRVHIIFFCFYWNPLSWEVNQAS